MQLRDFYYMSYDSRSGAVWVREKHRLGEDEFAVLTGREKPSRDCEYVQVQGSRLFDFLQAEWAALVLISQKVVTLLQENGFTGWTTYPARIHLNKGSIHDGHHLLVVTGRSGPIDWSKAPIIEKPPVVEGGAAYKVHKGLPFGLDEWDGSDVFVPAGDGAKIVTKRVRDSLVKARVSNLRIENCADYEIMPEAAGSGMS